MGSDERTGDPRSLTLTDIAPGGDLETELDSIDVEGEEVGLGADHVYLVVQQGDRRQVLEVAADQEVIIGRGEDCAITVDEVKVSRAHARITRRGQVMVVADLDSTNGTKLNGITLRGSERRLVGGDLVRVGRAEITVAASARSGISGRQTTSRLELELGRLLESGQPATLVRIDMPGDAGADSVERMASALGGVALVEERGDEGQYAALLEDTKAVGAAMAQLQKLAPEAEIGSARFPDDGQTLAALWRAASPTRDTEAAPESLPQGVTLADPTMMKVFRIAKRVAKTNTTVLILGETGVGKEVLAEQLHRHSARAEKPYVRLNCASLPETLLSSELFGHEKGAFTGADRRKIGYFEAANGGTLLLDEIGELSLSMQVKLLRVLENHTVLRLGATQEVPVDVRVVCATHRDLQTEVEAGRFREDLFYRISAFTLQVPPLRERPTEVGLLAELFVRQLSERNGRPPPRITDAAIGALTSHRWPGNVRELRNAVEHAVIMCDGDTIEVDHLPETIRAPEEPVSSGEAGHGGVRDKLAQIERASILKALADESGNQTRAAKTLGMSRRALIYKMAKYGIRRQ